jgi:drug/metabolite transporter (DMT)-like permease
MNKRWFTLVYFILALFAFAWAEFGGYSGIPGNLVLFVAFTVIIIAAIVLLFPDRPRKRRWLAVGTFFVLGVIGSLLFSYGYAYGDAGTALDIAGLLCAAAGMLSFYLIPPRMPLWPKKETPETQA